MVVNVVLDLDPLAGRAQQAGKGVAQHGVAQVSDVGGLVGVDVGVFHDDLGRGGAGRSIRGRSQQSPEGIIPFQEAVEVAGPRHLYLGDARNIGEILHDLGGDLTGRPPQLLGQLEAKRKGQVSQLDPGRLLGDHLGKGNPVAFPNVFGQPVLDTIDQRFQHDASGPGRNPSKSLHPNTVPALERAIRPDAFGIESRPLLGPFPARAPRTPPSP